MEQGEKNPTFKQLDILSKLYNVPRWVFISATWPKEYQFNRVGLAFRQFARDDADLFNHSKVRTLVAKVERLRDLILELREEIGETVKPFNPPVLSKTASPIIAAMQVREWLNESESLEFPQWREKLEAENIFVFMTSKYKGWSHIDRNLLRGLALHHPTLPIIIINDSDAKKAQSLTLFHELGHLLRGESALDDWDNQSRQIEKWCDELAGNVLMPANSFLVSIQGVDINDLKDIKPIADQFKASFHGLFSAVTAIKNN